MVINYDQLATAAVPVKIRLKLLEAALDPVNAAASIETFAVHEAVSPAPSVPVIGAVLNHAVCTVVFRVSDGPVQVIFRVTFVLSTLPLGVTVHVGRAGMPTLIFSGVVPVL